MNVFLAQNYELCKQKFKLTERLPPLLSTGNSIRLVSYFGRTGCLSNDKNADILNF